MTVKRLGLIMNGVTGRMGLNQHLIRSIVAIRDHGGVLLSNGDRVMPDPILVGRDAGKVAALAKRFNIARHTSDLDKALEDRNDEVFFDAATTQARPSLLTKAIQNRETGLMLSRSEGFRAQLPRDGSLNFSAIAVWVDRRQSAMIQHRVGPNRAVVNVPSQPK